MKLLNAVTSITINNDTTRSGFWSAVQGFAAAHPYITYGSLARLAGAAAYLCLSPALVGESAAVRLQKPGSVAEAIRLNANLRVESNHTRLRLEQLRNDTAESQLNATEHLINAIDALSQQAAVTDLVVRESAVAIRSLSTQLLEVHATVAQLGVTLL